MKLMSAIDRRLERFEDRFMGAMALGGITELLLALSPVGPLIGKHLQTFGYLGIGAMLIAGWHYVLARIARRQHGSHEKHA